jgi:hypothetical protein
VGLRLGADVPVAYVTGSRGVVFLGIIGTGASDARQMERAAFAFVSEESPADFYNPEELLRRPRTKPSELTGRH